MAPAVTYSLNDLLLAIGQFYNDARKVTCDQQSPSPAVFASSALAAARADRYVGSELWFWTTPPSGSENPFTVTASTIGGALTLSANWNSTGQSIPENTVAVLQNIGGKGKPHQQREWALRMALADASFLSVAEVEIETPDQETFWNDIPVGLRSVTKVYRVDTEGRRQEVGPAYWHDGIDPVGRKIYLPIWLNADDTFLLQGRQDLTFPWSSDPVDYTAQVAVNPARVVKDAVMWLSFGSRENRAPEQAANFYNDRLRSARNHPLSNEVWLE